MFKAGEKILPCLFMQKRTFRSSFASFSRNRPKGFFRFPLSFHPRPRTVSSFVVEILVISCGKIDLLQPMLDHEKLIF